MRAAWVAAPILLTATSAFAGMMFGLGRAPGGGGAYTPLCNISACTYVYSLERQLVSSATVAFQVERTVDSTTQDVGFLGNGRVNTATVDAFCNAAVSGLISRDCFISKVYDQSGNGCVVYNSTASGMPDYMVWPAHSDLPIYQKAFQGSTSSLNFLLDSNGGSTGALTNPCNILAGAGHKATLSSTTLTYANNIGGQFGLQENTPGVVTGSMYSPFIGIPDLAFGGCPTAPANFCGGVDTEGEGPQQAFTAPGIYDVVQVNTTPGGTGPATTYANGAQTSVQTIATNLTTQNRMSFGTTGDHTSNGPAMLWSLAFFNTDFGANSATAISLMANETAFHGTLSTGYTGPGDLFIENSTTAGLTTGHIDQMQWLAVGLSLRKAYAGYEGPALNVCKGQTVTGAGNCEDIGWVNDTIDTATMSAFCGPVSGLNNCAVQIWYNQALNQNSLLNSHNTALDATAATTAKRPTIVWSGCQTTAITVCIATSPTNYFTTNGIGVSSGGYTISVVAQRIGSITTSAIYSSATGTGPETILGFGGTSGTCFGAAHNGGGGPSLTGCSENVIHSLILDAATSPSASVILYMDGTASTAVTATVGYSTSGLGVGATGAGLDPCTCQLSEVLVYGDTHSAVFGPALGSANVAILRANQRAAIGF
jgi:hypothetical protein